MQADKSAGACLERLCDALALEPEEVRDFIHRHSSAIDPVARDRSATCRLSVAESDGDVRIDVAFTSPNGGDQQVRLVCTGRTVLASTPIQVCSATSAMRLVGLLLADVGLSAWLSHADDAQLPSKHEEHELHRLHDVASTFGTDVATMSRWVDEQAAGVRSNNAEADVTCRLRLFDHRAVTFVELLFDADNGNRREVLFEVSGRAYLAHEWNEAPTLSAAVFLATILCTKLGMPVTIAI